MIECYELQDAIDKIKSILNDKCKLVTPLQLIYIMEVIEAIRRCIIEEGSENAVLYIHQSKTDIEKSIARKNIDAIGINEVIDFIIDNSDYLAEQLGYELKSNKQNNLNPDGTGTKYPTVDAVNIKVRELQEEIDTINNVIEEIIVTNLQPQYFHFNNVSSVTCNHGLSKYPNVTVLIGTEEGIANIEHTPDMNTVNVRFSKTETGIIIIQ